MKNYSSNNREDFEKEMLPKVREYWASVDWNRMPHTWLNTLNKEDKQYVKDNYERRGGTLPDENVLEQARIEEKKSTS